MRVLLASIVATVLVAIPPSVASGEKSSGLEGKVMRGPVTPVCITTRPCQVAASVVLVFLRGGQAVGRVRSAQTGQYRIALAPGSYSVKPVLRAPLSRVSPQTVRVPVGSYRRVDFLVDTGIR